MKQYDRGSVAAANLLVKRCFEGKGLAAVPNYVWDVAASVKGGWLNTNVGDVSDDPRAVRVRGEQSDGWKIPCPGGFFTVWDEPVVVMGVHPKVKAEHTAS